MTPAQSAAWRRRNRSEEFIALLEKGRRKRAELNAQAKTARAFLRLQAHVDGEVEQIRNLQCPDARARRLGKLADWLTSRRQLLWDAEDLPRDPPRRHVTLAERVEDAGLEAAARWIDQETHT